VIGSRIGVFRTGAFVQFVVIAVVVTHGTSDIFLGRELV